MISAGQEQRGEEKNQESEKAMGEGSILIIEDDKYIYHFMDVSLTQEGYHVMVGQSAAEGMFLLRSNNPEIVLLDL